MKRIVAIIILLFVAFPAAAQTGTSKTVSTLTTEVNTLWPDNTSGAITPFNARQTLLDIINSYFNVQSGTGALPTINNNTVVGNVSGGTATATQITATQLTTLCNVFTSVLSGCAPNSPGGTTAFLRADGTWVTPPASGPAGSSGQVQFNSSAAFGASPDFVFVDPMLTLGANGINTGQLGFAGTTSGRVTVQSQDAAGTWTLKWPTSGGTNGFVLTTNGAGVTSWTNPAGGGTVTSIIFSGFLSATTNPMTTNGTVSGSSLAAAMSLRQGAL